jgi:hypothetical protein
MVPQWNSNDLGVARVLQGPLTFIYYYYYYHATQIAEIFHILQLFVISHNLYWEWFP